MAYFPLFMNIENMDCYIVGGGMVAYHKLMVLADFGARITMFADHFCEEIQRSEYEKLTLCEMKITEGELNLLMDKMDTSKRSILVIATNSRSLNHSIALRAKSYDLLVNTVDQQEDCEFIFPSYVREQNLVAAFSSGGKSPALTQYLKAREQDILTSKLGEINEYLGSIREQVKLMVPDEKSRKIVFKQILEYALEKGEIPDQDTICGMLGGF